MSRLVGIGLMVLILYGLLVGSFDTARSLNNHLDLARRLGFYGILTLGVGVLIVAGGIDLSIGSLVGLGAVAFGVLVQKRVPAPTAALIVILGSSVVGLFHGLLVTKLRLQPFLVTLCGLFIYRGIARTLSQTTVGLSVGLPTPPADLSPADASRWFDDWQPKVEALQKQADWFADLLVRGQTLHVPNVLWVMLAVAAVLAVVLHATVYGRYLYAVGSNEQAARYAGIATDRVKIFAYVVSAVMSGLGGVLYLMEYSTANPSTAGNLLELYAITGAVLGGCTLRGGEGSVAGMVLGAAVLPLLNKLCNFTPWIGSEQEYTVIGGALLAGTIVNELIRQKSYARAGRWIAGWFGPAGGG
jgi:ribose transport system permease protein